MTRGISRLPFICWGISLMYVQSVVFSFRCNGQFPSFCFLVSFFFKKKFFFFLVFFLIFLLLRRFSFPVFSYWKQTGQSRGGERIQETIEERERESVLHRLFYLFYSGVISYVLNIICYYYAGFDETCVLSTMKLTEYNRYSYTC